MRKQKLESLGRKLLIVLLVISAVLLLREAGSFDGGRVRLGGQSAGTQEAVVPGTGAGGTAKLSGTAMPLAAVVCLEDGGRYGVAYDASEVMAVFHRFSADLGEALGSAGAQEPVSEAEFRARLGGSGVFLRFGCPQPPELLSAWLGTSPGGAAGAAAADLFFLCPEGDSVALYCAAEGETYFRCGTAVPSEGICGRMETYQPNGARFAFEEPQTAACGCMVLLPGEKTAAGVKCTVPMPAGGELDALLQTVGMNSRLVSSYTEADGTVVFVDGEATLRLGPTGNVLYHRSAIPENVNDPGELNDAVDAAWKLAEQSIGKSCGDAVLMFAGAERSGGGRSITVRLDFAVEGIPAALQEYHAAELVLRGDTLLQARLLYRRYTVTEERTALLPPLQAAAIAAAGQSGVELVYAESGGNLNCLWVRSDG